MFTPGWVLVVLLGGVWSCSCVHSFVGWCFVLLGLGSFVGVVFSPGWVLVVLLKWCLVLLCFG